MSSFSRKRAERAALEQALAMVRQPDARTLAVDVAPTVYGKPTVSTTTPLDYTRGIQDRHPFPREWMAELRVLSPESLQHSYLIPGWLQGPEHAPIERWVLYEGIPEPLIPPEMREMLSGTPYWKMPKGRMHGRRQMVSAFQYDMYRKHRVWVRPFWCLQGDHGGTPARYSEMEEAILRGENKPTDPPAPGSLPFAPWDARVSREIQKRDVLYKLGMSIDRLRRSANNEQMKAETVAAEKEFRRRFLGWFGNQLSAQAEFLTDYSRKSEADFQLRPIDREEAKAVEMHEEVFIETGMVPTGRPGLTLI